jgi:hypothetical protein
MPHPVHTYKQQSAASRLQGEATSVTKKTDLRSSMGKFHSVMKLPYDDGENDVSWNDVVMVR